ncbi:protein NRT1/ PTR FAMILY 1.2-like [Nicotiana sylvestris]|uniref:protein NRT1/ PTR FAMILY 1.2-like n=1 Tax=Nicotiana sylvestris TaxID=4096 RepID=UPI00388CD45A
MGINCHHNNTCISLMLLNTYITKQQYLMLIHVITRYDVFDMITFTSSSYSEGFGFGTTVLWLTAMIPKARPPPCDQVGQACKSATASQFMLLVFAFLLMSIGAGGIRPCSLAFGANQFDKKNDPNN